ncbi:MADS-box transcription factor family protein [Forsythia ovata]|uniref:MADS-box transcription factor family protein n=1 Tax=Forsythia ovata TaxID=205694 RepID=A0ABD1W2U6_9LAMI
MVRRRVEIKKIEEKSKMYTTFTKRRQGLFKKTKVLCTMCEAEAAVLTFSKAGNAFFFGHPSVESVVKRYFADQSTNSEIEGNQDEFVVEPIPEAEKKIVELMGKGRVAWDVGVRNLGLFELDELAAAIQEIKNKVVAQAQEIINNGEDQEAEFGGTD